MNNPSGTKAKKYGFSSGGGSTHVRYDHKQRPAHIDIKCPQCGELAIALDQESKYESVGDMSPSWDTQSFSITCTKCTHRKASISYEDLTEPYFQIEGRGSLLWAWNRTHLDMIYKSIQGLDVKNHPYNFYQTYIHGDWKKYKQSYVKAITKYLNNT